MKKVIFILFCICWHAAKAQYGASSCMGSQTIHMNFANGVIVGTIPTPASPVTGMTITYANVLTNTPITQQVDAVFTLDAISWDGRTVEFSSFNPDVTATGIGGDFQPSFISSGVSVATPLGSYNLYDTWTVRFYLAGTTTPAFLPVSAQIIDNDGAVTVSGPGTFTIFESVTCTTPPSSIVVSTGAGGISPSMETISGNTVTANSTSNQPGIGTSPEYNAYVNYGNTSSFTIKFNHNLNYTSTGAPAAFINGNRYSSLHVGCDYAGNTSYATVNLSGFVLNDINGLTNGIVDGTTIYNPSSTQLYANLLSADGKTILATTAVASNGTYSFAVGANSNYQVQLTTTASTAGNAPATATLPSGWVATGESNNGLGTSSDGNPDLINTLVTVGASSVSNINFGIERLPESAFNTTSPVLNPAGTASAPLPAGAFATNNTPPFTNPNTSDYDGGTVTSIRITSFPTFNPGASTNVPANSITIDGTVYTVPGSTCPPATTCVSWPAAGVVTAYNSGSPAISVDPPSGAGRVTIPFAAIDNAGKEDPTPGSVQIPFELPIVNGNLFNDPNAGNVDNSTGTTNTVPAGLYANLVNASGIIVATAPLNSLGVYSLQGDGAGVYTVQLSNGAGTVGSAPTAFTAPLDWANTGAFNGTPGTGNTGNLNGISASFTISIPTPVDNINFGIERLPESAVSMQTITQNPGGTVNTTVTPASFVTSNVGSNPNTQDYNNGTVSSIRITSFPTNVTSITVGTTTYYPNAGSIPGTCPTATCLAWPTSTGVTVAAPGGSPSSTISVDPIDGPITLVIPFAAIDNGGKEDPTPGSITIRFGPFVPVKLLSFTATGTSNCNVQFSWATGVESQVDHFEIERSTDGADFKSIIKTTPTGSNSVYSAWEENASEGRNYYRLRIVDKNRQYDFSKTVQVTNHCNAANNLKIYPNPTTDHVTIDGVTATEKVEVQLLDVQGRLVFANRYMGSSVITVDTKNLAKGLYQMKIWNGNQFSVSKLIKQ